MLKYVQKILIVSQIRSVVMSIQGIPRFWKEIIKILNNRTLVKFLPTFRQIIADETPQRIEKLRVLYFWFYETTKYSFQRLPQMGRIKRKIRRKLIRRSHTPD